MRPFTRPLAAFAAVASGGALVATIRWSQGWDAVTVALGAALAWGTTISIIDAAAVRRHGRHSDSALSDRHASVTFVMQLGDERPDIARTNIVLAAAAGPVVVVATRHHEVLDELGGLEVMEHVAPTIAEAVNDASHAITTHALLLLSASAFPAGDTCERAAAQITDDVGWVTGTAPSFNTDRYAPGERELLGARARSRLRALGLETWEPDATLVRTSLLRDHPLELGRPDGRWLRARAADGWHGATVQDAVALRAAPADAPVFWPIESKRERGVVADLADATANGPLEVRLLAAGALLRELYAYPIIMWLLAFVLMGRNPDFSLSLSPLGYFTMLGTLALLRWTSSRLAYGVGLHPVNEARAAAYDFPGSLLALSCALRRRLLPTRLRIPDQPLLWIAFVLTLLTTIPLLDRQPTAGGAVGVGVGLAISALLATWMFALRAFGAHASDRTIYRIAVDVPATIDGLPARTIDASPSGLAAVGEFATLTPGRHAAVDVAFDAGHVSTLRGRVTDLRRAGDQTEVGVALELGPRDRVAWIRQLFAATGLTARVPTLPVGPARHPSLVFDREPVTVRHQIVVGLSTAALGVISLLACSALVLALFGFRPLVVRSASMAPTLAVGDVVITDWVHADRVRPGEIITFPIGAGGSQTITHRVEQVAIHDGTVNIVTKGDANATTERWSVGEGTRVGRVVVTVPSFGTILAVLGTSTSRQLLLGAGAAVVSALMLTALARRSRGPTFNDASPRDKAVTTAAVGSTRQPACPGAKRGRRV